MKRLLRTFTRDDRGQTLALMAVTVAGAIAMLSLAIDLGMLYTARSEAQRAAEAAALAGAQEFFTVAAPGTPAVKAAAHDSATAYAIRNTIRNVLIDTSEVKVEVNETLQLVSVRISRPDIPLFFARMVGRNTAGVSAYAAARAAPASAATCVLPWALPDMWDEAHDDTNGDDLWDPGETWHFDPDTIPPDVYVPFGSGTVSPPETGFGSGFRNTSPGGVNNDYGRPLELKVQNPGSPLTSSFVFPFSVGTANTNAHRYRIAIGDCDPTIVVPLNTAIPVENSSTIDVVGDTEFAVTRLIGEDPSATWDATTNSVSSPFGLRSPLVRIVPLYDPSQTSLVSGGSGTVTFNNFALIFIEGLRTTPTDIYIEGRFLYYAHGITAAVPGGMTGSLVRSIQLVQ
jgi:Flp pilus assembly protein TadG